MQSYRSCSVVRLNIQPSRGCAPGSNPGGSILIFLNKPNHLNSIYIKYISMKKKKGSVIVIKLKGSEVIERKVSKFGTGSHVVVPKEYLGKKVKIIIEGEDEDD